MLDIMVLHTLCSFTFHHLVRFIFAAKTNNHLLLCILLTIVTNYFLQAQQAWLDLEKYKEMSDSKSGSKSDLNESNMPLLDDDQVTLILLLF